MNSCFAIQTVPLADKNMKG